MTLRACCSVSLTIFAVLCSGAKDPIDPSHAPKDAPPQAAERWAPLGLPRLAGAVKPGKASKLAAKDYDIDTLDAASDPQQSKKIVRAFDKDGARILEIDPSQTWTRPLRGAAKGVLCVSFSLVAPEGTLVEIDGALVGLAQSSLAGCLEIIVGEPDLSGALKWRSIGIHISQQVYGGEPMASLPVLTVRLDRKAGVWDLYTGSLQVADSVRLPIPSAGEMSAGNFTLRTSSRKAWLCGLVQSSEMPLFEDANANGIDDDFERSNKGGVLSASLSLNDRKVVAEEWREASRAAKRPAWLVSKPRPD